VAQLGNGDDLFTWDPGEGSDVVEGGAGNDTLAFNGANVAENIAISANGSRAKLSRDVGNVTMDLNGMENIQLPARGGADTIAVNDLSKTDVKQVAIDLASTPGSGTGDMAADSVAVNGTAGGDQIVAASNGSSIAVTGLAAHDDQRRRGQHGPAEYRRPRRQRHDRCFSARCRSHQHHARRRQRQ
jgi:hypothetical protein